MGKVFNKGASRDAIQKYIQSNYNIVLTGSKMKLGALRQALKKAVDAGDLILDGRRYRLNPEKRKALRKPPAKKPKSKKPKTKKKSKKPKKKKTTKKTAKKSKKKTAK